MVAVDEAGLGVILIVIAALFVLSFWNLFFLLLLAFASPNFGVGKVVGGFESLNRYYVGISDLGGARFLPAVLIGVGVVLADEVLTIAELL